MTDPNPYEPPREPEPLTTGKVVKRGVGVGVILLLTPLAVLIAFGASCAATYAFLNTSLFGQNYGLAFIFGCSICLLPRIAVLVRVILCDSSLYRRRYAPSKKKSVR